MLEDSIQQMEIKMVDLESERKNLGEQVQHWKTVVNENEYKARDQVKIDLVKNDRCYFVKFRTWKKYR